MVWDEAADLVLKRGFSVIPLQPGGKKPLLQSWTPYQQTPPTEEELDAWAARWPDANVGIVTGAVSGIVVVDADGNDGLAWMREHLPVTGVYVKTGKGWHGYYRHPGGRIGNRTRLAPEVDIRADGGYVVAPPSVHANGTAYGWQYTPGLNGWDDLAEFPADKAPGTGFDLSDAKPLISSAPVGKGSRNDTLARLCGKWISVNRLDGDELLLMAKAWNSTLEEPLPDHELRRTVQSILDAQERNHPGASDEVPAVPEIPQPPEAAGIPDELLHPGGLLEMIMDYTEKSAAVSHPVFALAGAVAAVGSLMGQKWMTETQLRTNCYCFALGYSGAGKDAPQSALPNLINRSRAADIMAGNAFTGEAAILRWLSNEARGVALYLLDEIGLLLTAIKQPMSPAATIPSLLMKLFSGTDYGHTRQYADEKCNIVVQWHHLSLYGASTPDRFWESMTRGEATDGFLARCLIFESRHDVGRPKKRTDKSIPPQLLDRINDIADVPINFVADGGNLHRKPAPREVGKTADAEAFFDAWADKYFALRNEFLKTDESLSSIYGRAAEHAHKLALIHAGSLAGSHLREVGIGSVRWACALTDALTANTVKQMSENIADSEFHKLTQRAMKAIRGYCMKKHKNGAPRWYIENMLKGCEPRIVDNVLRKLEAAGRVRQVSETAANGKISALFCPSVPEEPV